MERKQFKNRTILMLMIIFLVFIIIGCTQQIPIESEREQTSMIESNTQSNDVKIKDFKLQDYQEEIDIFSCNKTLTKINDTMDLYKKAQKIWVDELKFEITSEYRVEVYYDYENETWMVSAFFDDVETDAAAPTVIIRADGTVLAVWRR